MREEDALAAVERLNAAVNAHDADAVAAAVTEDVLFDSTPPPDGQRFEGREAMRRFFAGLFDSAKERSFDAEETIVAGDRVIVLWRHRWTDLDGTPGSVRGVDVFRVRDDLVSEKLSYVKG